MKCKNIFPSEAFIYKYIYMVLIPLFVANIQQVLSLFPPQLIRNFIIIRMVIICCARISHSKLYLLINLRERKKVIVQVPRLMNFSRIRFHESHYHVDGMNGISYKKQDKELTS